MLMASKINSKFGNSLRKATKNSKGSSSYKVKDRGDVGICLAGLVKESGWGKGEGEILMVLMAIISLEHSKVFNIIPSIRMGISNEGNGISAVLEVGFLGEGIRVNRINLAP